MSLAQVLLRGMSIKHLLSETGGQEDMKECTGLHIYIEMINYGPRVSDAHELKTFSRALLLLLKLSNSVTKLSLREFDLLSLVQRSRHLSNQLGTSANICDFVASKM